MRAMVASALGTVVPLIMLGVSRKHEIPFKSTNLTFLYILASVIVMTF